MNKKRILVGMVASHGVQAKTVVALCSLMTSSTNAVVLDIQQKSLIYIARNDIARKVIEYGLDGVLFVDSDQVFPNVALNILLDHRKDIIGFPIVAGNYPYNPNIRKFENGVYTVYHDYPRDHIFQVDAIGMGFTYISKDVLGVLVEPYFFHEQTEAGELIGEDVYFCKKAKENGFKVWCDPTVAIGHIKNYEYHQEAYFLGREIKEKEHNESQ